MTRDICLDLSELQQPGPDAGFASDQEQGKK